VDKLAGQLRQKLTADPKVLKDLQAHAQRPSTTSVEALRAYEAGVALARTGDNIKAQQEFQAATTADPNFALAYSKLAETYSNLGHDDLARTAGRRAVELSETLPPQERYLIEANNARIMNDTPKAISTYEQLAAANPADTDVQFALAGQYEKDNNFPEAKKRLAVVLANDPKNVEALLASGRVAIKGGDAHEGLDFLSRALPLATELDNQEQKAAILQAMGVAYSSLDRPLDALRNFEDSLAIKQQIGDKRGAAASLNEIAHIQDDGGKPDAALATYKQALAIRREIGDQGGIASTLIDMGSFYHDHGKPADALPLYTEALQIERQLGDQSRQALCLNNIGTTKSDQGQYQDALTYLQQAYDLRQKLNVPGDIGESLHNLAEVNTKLGQYDAALADYLKAIETFRGINDQRGVAQESNGMARIFAAQGRYGAALGSMKDALNNIRQTKETTALTAEIVGGWGNLLAQVGRAQEGRPSLDEALKISQQIKDDATTALATNWLGDAYFYQGDYANARQQYDRAFQIASKTPDKEVTLISQVNRAKTDLALGHAPAVIPVFKKLAQDADALGLKAVSVECSVYLVQAEIAAKNTKTSEQELSLTLAKAENLGLRLLQAKTQYFQGVLLAGSNKSAEAGIDFREAVRILDGISKESGSTDVLKRADLKNIYNDAKKGATGQSIENPAE
jgi:tetratricopeptide (TPR) repeat protein